MKKINMPKIFRLQDSFWACVSLIALFFLFQREAFSPEYSFGLFQDNEFLFGPLLASMSAALTNGDWPFRMNAVLGGFPLYNSNQLSAFYPFYFLYLPIYKTPFDVIYTLHWIALLHVFILEVNMYILIRILGASRLAAITGSALMAFSANTFVYVGWLTLILPYSWLPLYLAGLFGILKNPSEKKYIIMALIGIVFITWASPAQPLIHAFFLTFIFLCAFVYDRFYAGRLKHIVPSLINICILTVLALLITAPVLLPALAGFKDMIRWVGDFPPVIGNNRIPFDAFLTDQLSIADLGGVFYKFKYGALGSQYVGLISIALACIAFLYRMRSWQIAALGFIAIYTLLSSAGSHLGFAHINYILPMLNKIRQPSRFLVLFQFAVSILAAFGIDQIRILASGSEPTSKNKIIISIAIVSVLSIIILFFTSGRITSHLPPYINLAVFFALSVITCLACFGFIKRMQRQVAVLWSVSALVLLSFDVPWLPGKVATSDYVASNKFALDLALQRVAELDPSRKYRVIFDGDIEKQKTAMLASYRDIRTLNSFICPAPNRQFQELFYQAPMNNNYFRVLGAKYLICKKCGKEATLGYRYLERVADYDIFESEDALPRNYLAQKVQGDFIGLNDFKNKVNGVDLKDNPLWIANAHTSKIKQLDREDNKDKYCVFREDIRKPNYNRFQIECQSSSVFVMNEFFDQAWRIKVNGAPKQLLRVNGNQMGVFLNPGTHIIEYDYFPKNFKIGLLLMLVGFILAFLFFSGFGLSFWKKVHQL